ncbi:hypothetical protein OHJ21_23280 [Virgibacillus sp. LDC1]|nr:hypothetical protein [Virgibacillus sp. LDC1]
MLIKNIPRALSVFKPQVEVADPMLQRDRQDADFQAGYRRAVQIARKERAFVV